MDRPTIKEVKTHRWLCDQPPMRETLTQDLSSIPLADFHTSTSHSDEEPMVTTGYLPMNQAPGKLSALKLSTVDEDLLDTDENVRMNMEHLPKEAMRQSLTAVKVAISAAEQAEIEIKAAIGRLQTDFSQKSAIMDGLKAKLDAKRRLFEEFKAREATLISQIADRTLELERLGAGNLSALTDTITSLQSSLSTKTTAVNQLELQLNRLKTDFSLSSQDEFDKEKAVKELKSKLEKLKRDLRDKQNSTVFETSDLALRASVTRAQLRESPGTVGQETEEAMREIGATLGEVRVLGKNDEFGRLRKRIQSLEDSIFEREEALSRLTAQHQEAKFDIILKTREAKAKIQSSSQAALDRSLRDHRQTIEAEKKRLRAELDRSREGCKPVGRLEYEQVREQLLVSTILEPQNCTFAADFAE